MTFHLEDYEHEKDVCMHCCTQEEAEFFTKLLDEHGRTWATGRKYTNEGTHYWLFGSNSVYYFNCGRFSGISEARDHNCRILEFSSFVWEEQNDEFEIDDLSISQFIDLIGDNDGK